MKHKRIGSYSLKGSLLAICLLFGTWACSKKSDTITDPTAAGPVTIVTTTADKTKLLAASSTTFGTLNADLLTINVDTNTTFQSMDGFGYNLTGGSAMLIYQMEEAKREALLQEIFGKGKGQLNVSYIRIGIGASDLSEKLFSYDDLPSGQTDESLSYFSLANDTLYVLPLLKRIVQINPSIKIMASPWSPPTWMKTNNSTIGGNLKEQYYSVYAAYLVKYIQTMTNQGIVIDAMSIQNEPQHGGNNPSMVMSFVQQRDFIKNFLGPAFQLKQIDTKILIWDHNCDNINYPLAILDDPGAKQYIDGSAFHLYGGDISALSTVREKHPDKNLYFTEQWTGYGSNFGDDLLWHTRHLMIGAPRNWSKNVLEWNLAADANLEPHTPGGCSQCLGALTITGNNYTRNVSYYITAHSSSYIPANSVRVNSTYFESLPNVAYLTPEGKKVLVISNESGSIKNINIKQEDNVFSVMLEAKSVTTIIW